MMIVSPEPVKKQQLGLAPQGGSPFLIKGEARLLRGSIPQNLLHSAKQIEAVYSFDTKGQRVDYREGADWELIEGGIARTRLSSIPDFDEYRYSPDSPCTRLRFSKRCLLSLLDRFSGESRHNETPYGSPVFWFESEPRNPPLSIEFNVYVDYVASVVSGMIDAKRWQPAAQKVVCLGDSITAGAHTVAHYYGDNDSQSWCGLLARQFKGEIEFVNISLGGAGIGSFAELYRRYEIDVADADVVIIAPGMNDHIEGAKRLGGFSNDLEAMVKRFQDQGKAVILVGFFQQNPLWIKERTSDTKAYNEAIQKIATKQKVPFVEILETFETFSPTHDGFYHLTGDFMHHPNIYGQRIYFSQILPYFLERPIAFADAPDFVIPKG